MENLKLGQIINAPQQRDAIHIAVAPVVAAERLNPGEHVSIGENGASLDGKPIGIVDPYLKQAVLKGQQCWIFLYPGSITSLRHEWEHPALPLPENAARSASEKWMRAWAMDHVSEDYYGDGDSVGEDAAYRFAIQAGHNNHIGPYESARDHIDDEWWRHWEAITGQPGSRDYFSCSC